MSHDHLEVTADHPLYRWVPQVGAGLLTLTAIFAAIALWNGFAMRVAEPSATLLRQEAFSRVLVGLLVLCGTAGLGTWWLSSRWRPRTIRLTARTLNWDGQELPLHDVHALEVNDGRPVVTLAYGTLELPAGYTVSPEASPLLLAAARRALAGIASAQASPEAQRAIERLREG